MMVCCSSIAQSLRRRNARHGGYVLLETVIATGMLIVGLAVIGAQVQAADQSVRKMERRIRALNLAQQLLAELEMGLIKLDSVDEIEEGDYGPRYPDFGWLLTTEKTTIETMYLLKLEVFHLYRNGQYREDDFEYDAAELIVTVYAWRNVAQPVNFAEDFGLTEEEADELSERFDSLGIEGLSIDSFDPSLLQKIDFEELLAALPLIMEAIGMDASQLTSMIPPSLMQQLKDSGLFGEEGVPGLDELGLGGEQP